MPVQTIVLQKKEKKTKKIKQCDWNVATSSTSTTVYAELLLGRDSFLQVLVKDLRMCVKLCSKMLGAD